MKKKNAFFQKALCLIVSAIMLVTGVINGLFFDITAFARDNSDSTLLTNYEFGNPNYASYTDANNCPISDTMNTSRKMYSNSWNSSGSNFNSGSDLYNQNGFICGDFSAINGKSSYRIEYKVSKEGNEAMEATVIALGTSTTATGIADSDTCNIMHLHHDGKLYIAGSDKGTIDDLAIHTSNENTSYTITFNEQARLLTIARDSKIAYYQSLTDNEINYFKNVYFVSLGTQASDGSYGWYTGAINCHYYYLRAYDDKDYPQTVDAIKVDPVIYTHGDATYENNNYGYMMYGNKISSAETAGEECTSFTLPQGAVIQSVTAGEDDNIDYTYRENKYILTGNFDSKYFEAKGNNELYVDLCFKYTYNSHTYIEFHRFSVKTNPVPTHAMIYAQSYTSVTQGNKGVLSFQTVALGSTGALEQSIAKSDAWSGKISHTYRANSWNIYDPYDSNHSATSDSSGSLDNAFVNKTGNSPVDKVAGFGVTGSRNGTGSSNKVNIGVESETAEYYVDKSADGILGITHNAGESTYSLNLFTENIYQNYKTDNGTVHIVQHEFNGDSGYSSLSVQTNSNWSNENGIWKTYNIWDNNQKGSETVTLVGSTDNGNVLGSYWTAGECYNGNQAKATAIIKIKVNVFDKSSARNDFLNTKAKYNSQYYSTDKWSGYVLSRLKVEGQLANYQVENVSNDDVQVLKNAYDSLGTVCDYSALIAAIKQAKQTIDNATVYEDTATLKSRYDSVLSQAFYEEYINDDLSGINSWPHKIQEQDVVDSLITELQFEYTQTVVKKSNLNIIFNVYLDDELVATKEYLPAYQEETSINAADVFSNAHNYRASKWEFGGVTVANGGYTYTLSSKISGTLSCYLISTPADIENQCKVTLFDYSNRKEKEYYVSQNDTYATVLSIAKEYSDVIMYYSITGWLINGSKDYNYSDTLSGISELLVVPLYSPTVEDYTVNVSGGSLVTDGNFNFDSRAYITFDENNASGDFLCWVNKYDDNSYRVASYDTSYYFYVSGDMQFVAITTDNYESYKNKLQLNTTDSDDVAKAPTVEDLQSKKPIPSIRGISEDKASVNGTVWNESEHKLYVIAQVASGAEYDSCGLVLTYNGKTLVTNSVSQTDSNQFMITYKLGASTKDRNIKIMAFSKDNEEKMIYSPQVDVTIPADSPLFEISNDLVKLEYNSNSGLYTISQNDNKILIDVSAEYKLGTNSSIYNVSSYPTHSCSKELLNDDAGKGIMLKVVSKKNNFPTVEQVFKIYENKPYVLTDATIKYDNGYEISSNYIAPVVASGNNAFMNGSSPWTTFLYTPIDNDSWSKFLTYSLTSENSIESHEVSAIYDTETKAGLIVGSVTHDQWKTGVSYQGSNNSISSLKAYGGAKTIEISSENSYRGEEEHGAVKGNSVKSPTIFIGNYDNWQNGMMEFTSANTAITPMRQEGDLGGVPFGWNSWGSIADSLTYENATGNINKIKELYQTSWETDINGNKDSTPVVMNLDSWWNEISAYDGADNEATMKAYVAECKKNGQIAGIYHTPFVSWASESQMNDENEAWWTHPERVLRKTDGTMYGPIDGGYPLDVTRPDVIEEAVNRIKQFKEWGFEYVKLDFLSHGFLEGKFYNPDITTGMEAYNYAMGKIVEEVNKDYGTQMFINLSIAPLFPYQYANGRRMGCDSWYSTENTQYTLNQLTYGFWERGIYKYPDPDHAMIYGRDGKATEGQARNVMTLNAAVAGNMLLGDSFVDYQYKKTTVGITTTATYSASGCIDRANNVLWNKDIIALAKKNKTFRSVIYGTPSYANVYRMDDDNGDIYFAVFNFSGTNTYLLDNLPTDSHYRMTELWSGEVVSDSAWAWVDVQLSGETSKIYKFSKV